MNTGKVSNFPPSYVKLRDGGGGGGNAPYSQNSYATGTAKFL
jgi:hypothetical protein